jgi:hypothetical protein
MPVREEHSCLATAVRCVLALHTTSTVADRNWLAWSRQIPADRAKMAVLTGMEAIVVIVSKRRIQYMIKWVTSRDSRHSAQAKLFSRRLNKLWYDRARKLMKD